MTDMEKKVMLRLCAKVMQYVDLSEDLEAENLVNWVCWIVRGNRRTMKSGN